MYQIDDNFLDTAGLGDMPVEEKQAFLQHLREQLELRVGERLSEGLTEQQAKEFDAFVTQDENTVLDWYAEYFPNYQGDKEFQSFKQSAPEGVSDLAVMCEYGALRWLTINRPNYKDVVAEEIEKLRQEVADNKDKLV